ncbi:MAG TPA: WYL domain-containing protein [Verrucomicrobiae bacterium]|nr:WYL domain-containing protein [Verrucomicrobiae bacterium]
MQRFNDSTNNVSRHARPPLERMLRIHQAIQSGKFPNANSLAAEIEVSPKTIQRDMEFMRDRMNLPLKFDPVRHGYFYDGEVSAFPTMQITEGELFALVVAEKALQQYRGTMFEKPLLSALKKMEQSLPDTISLNLDEIGHAISFRTRAEPVLNLEILDALAKAVSGRKQLELQYRKAGAKKAEPRIVDPYHLANINGEWFLFAHDHARKDIRTFVPPRIQSLKQTGKIFPRPEKFSLEKRLRGSFGVHSGEGKFEVVLRFSPRVADYVREKKWHESQQLRDLRNSGVELKLKLSSLEEIKRWILSWAGDVTILKPKQLKEMVRESAKKLLQDVG